jgi:predicted glycosyltransferase
MKRRPLQLAAFTGPFMPDDEFDDLQARAGEGIVVRRFTSRFLEVLSAADLSISLAGYNTCMNLLTTGVPALVLPYRRQREQPLRVEKLLPFLPLQVLEEQDLDVGRLMEAIERGWTLSRRTAPVPVRLDGAEATAAALEDLGSMLQR